MLTISRDFKDLLSEFNANKVEFLIVGAYAIGAHGLERGTTDLDLWIRPTPKNAKRILKSLHSFGVPLCDLTIEDLSHPKMVFQIGNAPVHVDLITSIKGVTFEDAWKKRLRSKLGGEPASVLSREDLITNKKRLARSKDIVDLEWLEKNSS